MDTNFFGSSSVFAFAYVVCTVLLGELVAKRWYNCKHLLSGMRFYCSHIYHEGNAMANGMVSMDLGHTVPDFQLGGIRLLLVLLLWWGMISRSFPLIGLDSTSDVLYLFYYSVLFICFVLCGLEWAIQ